MCFCSGLLGVGGGGGDRNVVCLGTAMSFSSGLCVYVSRAVCVLTASMFFCHRSGGRDRTT